jgi:CheY-like chemotaxis protein
MSHELRTPLNAIIGFGQLLATAEDRLLEAERGKEFVNHIVEAGRHLLTLINDILNLAQIEAGKLSVSVEVVSLADVLAECRAMTEAMAAQRSIRLLFPPPDELRVQADRTRLKQVLLNLLSNAVKYNRETGSVVIGCDRTGDKSVRISVQDTGVGMRADQLSSLFQPFNRLGQEAGVQEGTGIGLVLTKRIVELMGGQLRVTSTPGVGTVFSVELPAPDQAAEELATSAEAAAARPEPRSDSLITLLCVEDNPVSMKLIEEVVGRRGGIRLLTAQNGKLGLEMARAHLPDVILMDNNMPVMTGREAQRLLAADPRTTTIPVIALSADAMTGSVAKGLAAGYFRYLTKPVDIAELNDALEAAIAVAARARSVSS